MKIYTASLAGLTKFLIICFVNIISFLISPIKKQILWRYCHSPIKNRVEIQGKQSQANEV